MVVWKYELPTEEIATVAMPRGARILHVGEQDAALYVWALVDPDGDPVPRLLRVADTGEELGSGVGELGSHVGSVVGRGGLSVSHVFDLGEAKA